MNRLFDHTAFAVGLLAIAWVGAGYLPGHPLALALVLCIGAFYVLGALDLHRHRQATASLQRAVGAAATTPPGLDAWLAALHPSLRQAVRLRVEGERVALPGPALAPYLAGLLVLLGMLGTFLGMVVTLQGTGLALERASDVEAIRASLAAPVQGLGLAFGTSVAGVAASAMLGLMAALARGQRQRCGQQLDARIGTTLRVFSRGHQRDTALRLLQAQADAVPVLVAQLQVLAAQMDRQAQAQHASLLESQQRFQEGAAQAYAGLAASVGTSLKASLVESTRVAAAALQPAVLATLQGLAHEAAAVQAGLAQHAQQAVAGTVAAVEQRAALLLQGVADAHAAQAAASATREAELITEMRAALSASLSHDTALQGERRQQAVQLSSALAALDAAATRFAGTVDAQAEALQGTAAEVSAGAAELASLGDGFAAAVQLFSRASEQTTAQLQRIEAALAQSMARSDEQLAYYVAQAREIVDLTLGAQKQMVDDLQRLAPNPAAHAA
jgi:hypothetical protein